MDQDEVVVNQISERIIGCAFRVMNTLGIGFLEKVYENALAHELRTAGLRVTQQQAISVSYNGINVGDYTADLLVESTVVVELKAVKALDSVHTAQCINYLKASRLRLCCCSISASHVSKSSGLPTDLPATWRICVNLCASVVPFLCYHVDQQRCCCGK